MPNEDTDSDEIRLGARVDSEEDEEEQSEREIRKRLEQGMVGVPILKWYEKKVRDEVIGYKEARKEIRLLMESSHKRSKTMLSYPLIDFYTGLSQEGYEIPGSRDFAVRPSVVKIYKDPRAHGFTTDFPFVIGDRIMRIGLCQTRQEWLFSKKKDIAKPTKVEREDEKYYIRAIVEYLRKGILNTDYEDAEGEIRAVCEGRFGPETESSLGLFEYMAPFFKELKARNPTHPLKFELFSETTPRGKKRAVSWREYFDDLYTMYNQSIYAKTMSAKKGNTKWGGPTKRGPLQIPVLKDMGGDDEAVNDAVIREQWIIYSMLSDYFTKHSELKEMRTGKIIGAFESIDDGIATMLNWLNEGKYQTALRNLTKCVERYSEGAWPPPGGERVRKHAVDDLQTIYDHLFDMSSTVSKQLAKTQKKTYKLLCNIRVYREYIDEVLTVKDLTLEAGKKMKEWEWSKKPIDTKEAEAYAKKMIHLVDAIFGPLDNLMISYALMTVILRRYLTFFVARMLFSCKLLILLASVTTKPEDKVSKNQIESRKELRRLEGLFKKQLEKLLQESQEGEREAGGEENEPLTDDAEAILENELPTVFTTLHTGPPPRGMTTRDGYRFLDFKCPGCERNFVINTPKATGATEKRHCDQCHKEFNLVYL